MKYTRLTKTAKDANGNEYVACVFYGTEECHIHTGVSGCATCPVFAAILNQLCEFETMMEEGDEEDEERS